VWTKDSEWDVVVEGIKGQREPPLLLEQSFITSALCGGSLFAVALGDALSELVEELIDGQRLFGGPVTREER
jgi:hypothetical protein